MKDWRGVEKSTPDVYIKEYDIWFRKLGKFPLMHYLKFAMHNKEYYNSLLVLLPYRKEAELRMWLQLMPLIRKKT